MISQASALTPRDRSCALRSELYDLLIFLGRMAIVQSEREITVVGSAADGLRWGVKR